MSPDDTSLTRALLGAAAQLEAAIAKRLKEISRLDPRQAMILKALGEGPLGMDALAGAAACRPETLPLQDLVEKSLITLKGEFFTLTGEGEELLGYLWPTVAEAEAEALAGMSGEARAQLMGALGAISAASQRVIDEANPWADEDEDYS